MMLFVWLTYGIPSVLLIIWFLPFLNRKEFKYSFYRILQCDMIVNVACYLSTWIYRLCNVEISLEMMIWVNYNRPFLLAIGGFSGYFFFNMQAMSVILMSMHRLWSSKSAVGNEFWNRNYHRAYLIIIMLSIGFTVPAYLGEFYLRYAYDPETREFHMGTPEKSKEAIFGVFFMLLSFVYFSIILIINIWTICTIKEYLKSKSTDSKTRSLMRNLTTIAFINTIVFFSVSVWQLFGKLILIQFSQFVNNYIVMTLSDVVRNGHIAVEHTIPAVALSPVHPAHLRQERSEHSGQDDSGTFPPSGDSLIATMLIMERTLDILSATRHYARDLVDVRGSFSPPNRVLLVFSQTKRVPILILSDSTMRYDSGKSPLRTNSHEVLQNVFCYLNTWTMRLCHVDQTFQTMIWVNYNMPSVFLISSFFAYFFYNAQAFSVIIMSVQRLWSSMVFNGNEFWSRHYRLVYGLSIFLSFAITFPVIYWEFYLPYCYFPEKNTFHSGIPDPQNASIFAVFFLGQSFLYFIVILVVNIWTIFTVKQHLANISTSVRTKNMIRNLTTIAIVNTFVFFCVSMWQVFGKFIFITIEENTDFHIIMIMSDILSLSLPYLLLMFDKNVRNTLGRVITTCMMGKTSTNVETSGSIY